MPAVPGQPEPLRLVLDTNVVISALLWRGTPYRLLQAIRQHEQITLFASIALVEELAEVLTRSGPAKRLACIGATARAVLADYLEAVDLVTPLAVPAIVAADPDDDQVIAAAMAASADCIVSGDQHLLALGRYGTVRIVTPAEVLGQIDR